MSDFDREGFGAVPVDLLRRYLSALGWRPRMSSSKHETRSINRAVQMLFEDRASGPANFDIYVSTDDTLRGIELLVPNSSKSADYVRQISRVIGTLADIADMAEEDIAQDIRGIGFDVVRSRIPNSRRHSDTIGLDAAQAYVSGIRSVLASTATTELNPQPYFLRLKKEAIEYADRCKFGHTFRGSFGFTIESPLEANSQPALFDEHGTAPFERRVICRLAYGLQTISDAVAEDSVAPITNSIGFGFSANVCENLATLIEGTSGTGMTFDVTFSPEWTSPPYGKGFARFSVALQHAAVARAAAKELRDRNRSWDETVSGRVIRLATDANPSDFTDMLDARQIAIAWNSTELGFITVITSLSPSDYLLAVEAHAAGQYVEVSGTLEKQARRWVLGNPTDFSIQA